ncbi:MAG: ExsB family transcriptional regulator [Candidatus Aenigmarchaeota archaeon]|nr:ExsB family transcriptional regulator [Candidatus Aenigmarchaeota archaeon]
MAMERLIESQSDAKTFVDEKIQEIQETVGDGQVINALSGGVDSSAVTMLGHQAIGDQLETYFIDNALMRDGEPEQVAELFKGFGVDVEIVDARKEFLAALKGVTGPEEKREAVTQTFYKDVFGRLVKESSARYLLQGTILTDVEETEAGIKRQHNVLEQLGINTQEEFGYVVLEPLLELRKSAVRRIAKYLGLSKDVYNRMPFPGPALATRIIGEVTHEKLYTVRKATAIVEHELEGSGAFQYLAILHNDQVTGVRDGKRDFGYQIEVRCWNSTDAVKATPTKLTHDLLSYVAGRLTKEVPGVVSVTYNITNKPTSTIEAI